MPKRNQLATHFSVNSDKSYPVVDERDELLFNIRGKDRLHAINQYHRGVHIFIETFGVGNVGFVLQLKHKDSENGGKWSSAISGHVQAGETYQEAAIREAEEELGLEIPTNELVEVVKAGQCEETNKEFVTLYTYLLDRESEVLDPNSNEIKRVIISTRDHVIEDVARNRDKFSPAFVMLFNRWLTLEVEEA